jgi:hypothetical protein
MQPASAFTDYNERVPASDFVQYKERVIGVHETRTFGEPKVSTRAECHEGPCDSCASLLDWLLYFA